MTVTIWGGTLIFVEASFQRTTTYGLVSVAPIDDHSATMRTIVWVQRSSGAVARAIIDPLDAWLRRQFIHAFLMEDAVRSDGVRYNPATVIEADRGLAAYMAWLESICAVQPDPSQFCPGGSHVCHS